jgi:hypothetical protein
MLRVAPVTMVAELLKATEKRNVPEVEAVHTEMSVTTSPLVPAQVAQDGVLLSAIDPAEAALNVTDTRVVLLEMLLVPLAPGDAV